MDEIYNKEYILSIQDELIELDDFIPFGLLINLRERNQWLKNNNKQDIISLNKEYKLELHKAFIQNRGPKFILATLQEFIEKYPKYENIILKERVPNLKKDNFYPMEYEEFVERVTCLFLNRRSGNKEEKIVYLESEEGQEVLKGLYKTTCYDYRGSIDTKPYKYAFDDIGLEIQVVSTLELLY